MTFGSPAQVAVGPAFHPPGCPRRPRSDVDSTTRYRPPRDPGQSARHDCLANDRSNRRHRRPPLPSRKLLVKDGRAQATRALRPQLSGRLEVYARQVLSSGAVHCEARFVHVHRANGLRVEVASTLRPKYPLEVRAPATVACEYCTPTARATAPPVALLVEGMAKRGPILWALRRGQWYTNCPPQRTGSPQQHRSDLARGS